ncbi:enoyl-CoA hydratase [[Mycobacterium] vasticus]|uniref:Enoyl-CoA hydratase n=1 Tax=[Mycobacterium] vasticus TaxID=2875777 RepID=A0ABU5Z2U0_9MYCO|nr:enoyl-CoA hydratase [Mycolicibacter sp. MYC017]MEB3071724.1 enoyl-CoA hydratase [Mycolicibacter sp. MYC017]
MITADTIGGVGLIIVDRHERRNALDVAHCDMLRDTVRDLGNSAIRALVITGRGTSFCAGADLDGVYGDGFRNALYRMLSAVTELPVPVIAAVNGPAIGAGTQLAIACDLRVAAKSAAFAIPTARNGLAVNPWTLRRLSVLAGGATARAMLLGCQRFDADLALHRGLVDRIGDLDAALEWAGEIATYAPLSLRYSKKALDVLFESESTDPALDAAFEECWSSEDLLEATRARVEKRAPQFQGR